MESSPRTPHSPPEPGKNGVDAAVEVDIQRRFNELRRELLDGRSKNVDRWLTAIAVIGVILGIVGFQRFSDIEADARRYAEEAGRLVEEIREIHGEATGRLAVLRDAQTADEDPEEAARTVASVQQDPAASVIDRAVAAAVLLQQQGKFAEAIEKWRAIANVAEDSQLQARAWFSIGYLHSQEERADLEAEMDAYTRAIELNPAYAAAYNNRGNAKADLRQYAEAIADYDQALRLNPAYALAYNNRGNAKDDLGQYAEAIADYDQALRLNPAYSEAYNNRGIAKRSLRRINEARADYQQALALAQEAGDENLVAMVKNNLRLLDNNAEP